MSLMNQTELKIHFLAKKTNFNAIYENKDNSNFVANCFLVSAQRASFPQFF